MEFKDQIKQISDRVNKIKSQIHTEEATKNALVMPFIQALGYDIFNPLEVVPEFTVDIGIKKGEKVDYAIMKDGRPIILIECKNIEEDLSIHGSQLFRYFHTTSAKFSILTNGVSYNFYSDLMESNKMDEKPFLSFSILSIKDFEIAELKKFSKTYFDVNNIINTANELKYCNEIKLLFNTEINQPSEQFTRFWAKQVYSGVVTQKALELFTPIVKKTLNQYINEAINDRLQAAITKETEDREKEHPLISIPAIIEPCTEFTELEREGYYILKSILRVNVDSSRVYYRDTQSYCNVILDDNILKTICRLYFNNPDKLSIGIRTTDKNFQKFDIKSPDGLYDYKDQFLQALDLFIKPTK